MGDPCALPRRSALTAVTTLTLRRARDGTASFLLHWRDPARVNHAGGLYQVMPAGIFQPVSAAPAAQRHDFSLWRCMTREFSEELLGGSEEYPTRGGRLDYGRWPFHRELAAARDAGTLRVSCLGLGVDPLTLATDILTVAVFEAAVFDRVFRGLVGENAEGRVVTQDGSAAIPFTQANVARFTGGAEPVQTAGQALLRLAWQHREFLGSDASPGGTRGARLGKEHSKGRALGGQHGDEASNRGGGWLAGVLAGGGMGGPGGGAPRTSLRIVAVPVLPPRMTAQPGHPRTPWPDVVEQSMSQALAAAAQQAAAQQPGLAIDTQLLAGAPAEVLVGGRAGRLHAGPGLPRRRGFSAMILGSVSRYVATHAPVPVVVAREETTVRAPRDRGRRP